VRVAIAQLRLDAADDSARGEALEAAIARASELAADLVVLPELAASGYLLDDAHLQRVAEHIDGSGPMLSTWRAAAARHQIAVIGGFAERRDDGRLANAVAAIERDGSIVGHYRKLHLFAAEHDIFVPGDVGLPIVEIAGAAVGILVCYDLRFPEAARILALRDAELVAVPTAWVAGFDRQPPEAEIGQVRGALVQANLDQVFIACADQVGREGPHEFLGRSLVVDPFGTAVLGPLDPCTENVAMVEIDLASVRAARHRGDGINPRSNRRTDVYDALLGYQPTTMEVGRP
jgi:predicted amidohydrolase